MDKEKEVPKRKPTRLQAFDYNTTGAYFITICTDKRRQILSRIVGVDVLGDPQNVELLSHGMVADKYIKQMNEFYENITVDQYIIMPNHIHLILFVHEDGSPRTSTPTMGMRVAEDVDPYNFYKHPYEKFTLQRLFLLTNREMLCYNEKKAENAARRYV